MTYRTQILDKSGKMLVASLVAVMIGSASLVSPAAAGGSVSLSYAPSSARDAQAVRTGLQVYSLLKNARRGSIRQNGRNNEAGLRQNGRGNLGIVHQEGNGHSGTLHQNGNQNAHGLFQFGENTRGRVIQNGHGQTGATVQFGW